MKWRSLEESNETDLRPLREVYAERKALIEKYVPQEIRNIHAQVVAELKASAAADGALPAGVKVENFERKRSRRQTCFFSGVAEQGPPCDLLHSWTMVSVLCWTSGKL